MFSAEATGAVVAAGLAAVSAPQPALAARASDEDDEAPQRRGFFHESPKKRLSYPGKGFDVRILAVLALPLFAISWALFNVAGLQDRFLAVCRSFVADARG